MLCLQINHIETFQTEKTNTVTVLSLLITTHHLNGLLCKPYSFLHCTINPPSLFTCKHGDIAHQLNIQEFICNSREKKYK